MPQQPLQCPIGSSGSGAVLAGGASVSEGGSDSASSGSGSDGEGSGHGHESGESSSSSDDGCSLWGISTKDWGSKDSSVHGGVPASSARGSQEAAAVGLRRRRGGRAEGPGGLSVGLRAANAAAAAGAAAGAAAAGVGDVDVERVVGAKLWSAVACCGALRQCHAMLWLA